MCNVLPPLHARDRLGCTGTPPFSRLPPESWYRVPSNSDGGVTPIGFALLSLHPAQLITRSPRFHLVNLRTTTSVRVAPSPDTFNVSIQGLRRTPAGGFASFLHRHDRWNHPRSWNMGLYLKKTWFILYTGYFIFKVWKKERILLKMQPGKLATTFGKGNNGPGPSTRGCYSQENTPISMELFWKNMDFFISAIVHSKEAIIVLKVKS